VNRRVVKMIKRWIRAVMIGAALLTLVAFIGAVNGNAEEKELSTKTTLENLLAAYKGEVNAQARYLAYAKKAEEEGYGIAASLFRAAAYAEQVHYERDSGLIRKYKVTPKKVVETPLVKSTKENLEAAITAESYENKVKHWDFVRQAQKEGNTAAVDAFEDAGAAAGAHVQLFQRVLNNLELSKGLVRDYYVCPVCGNILDSLTRSRCPICATYSKEFKRIR
jgi:rubrerythrin